MYTVRPRLLQHRCGRDSRQQLLAVRGCHPSHVCHMTPFHKGRRLSISRVGKVLFPLHLHDSIPHSRAEDIIAL